MVYPFHILQKVRRTIALHHMLEPGDKVVVAVSGGADSVCLLDLLTQLGPEYRLQLIVAHLDHGLRPHEDEIETRFVEQLAAQAGAVFEIEKALLLKNWPVASLEEKAREARYAFLEKVKDKHQAQKIALGHNLNDQAETVLMRLLRGSGAKGLAGIPRQRGSLIRPLLGLSEAEIRAYLQERGLDFCIDSSNLKTDFLRNKIRLDLMPRLLEYQPRLIRRLGHLAALLREENDYLEKQAGQWLESVPAAISADSATLPLAPFLAVPIALQQYVVRLLIGRVQKNLRRVQLNHIEAIVRLAQGRTRGTQLHLPNGLLVKRSYEKLIFQKQPEPEPAGFSFYIPGPGRFEFKQINCAFNVTEHAAAGQTPAESLRIACLDAEKIVYPLEVRNFRPGDRFIPLGMQSEKKLKNFFIDLKIPREQRRTIPILLSIQTIVWISGYRIDDRFKITPQTRRILRIEMEEMKK